MRIELVEVTGEEGPEDDAQDGILESISFGWVGVFSVILLIIILLAAVGARVKRR